VSVIVCIHVGQMVDRVISTAELKFSFLFNIVPGLYIDLC
jgi:hypothetical protein